MREINPPYLGGPELFSRRADALLGGVLEHAAVAKALYKTKGALTKDELILQAGTLVIKYHVMAGTKDFSISGAKLREGIDILTDLELVQQIEDKLDLTPAGSYMAEILSQLPSPV